MWQRQSQKRLTGTLGEAALLLDSILRSGTQQQVEIELMKLGCSKTSLFCTINCSKGLKVQDLYLICILRTSPTDLFVSAPTPFPSAQNRHFMENPSDRYIESPLGPRRRNQAAEPDEEAATLVLHHLAPPSSDWSNLKILLLQHPFGAGILPRLDVVVCYKGTCIGSKFGRPGPLFFASNVSPFLTFVDRCHYHT